MIETNSKSTLNTAVQYKSTKITLIILDRYSNKIYIYRWVKTKNMEEENNFGMMVLFTKAIGGITRQMERVNK
jgi:hypothetical protein